MHQNNSLSRLARKTYLRSRYALLKGKVQQFDEGGYLQANPDVSAAVDNLLFFNGQHHWLLHGRKENRPLISPGTSPQDQNLSVQLSPITVIASIEGGDRQFLPVYRALLSPLLQAKSHIADFLESDPALRFDEVGYLLANPDVCRAVENGAFLSGRHHWLMHGQHEGRSGSGISPYARRKRSANTAFGAKANVHFYGPISATSGLGTAARSYVDALCSLDINLTVIDSTGILYPGRPYPAVVPPKDKPNIVIIHHNADCLHSFFATVGKEILDNVYSIGIWVWELATIPANWVDHFDAFDEVWSPSRFSADAVSSIARGTMPIRVVPHAVERKTHRGPRFDRRHFGLPEDAFLFLVTFDATSGAERKNPHAVLEAFRNEFQASDKAVLVIKTLAHSENLSTLKALCVGHDVFFIEQTMSEAEMEGLRDSCDCFVSAHRSEGFGLNIAESMLAGKPVIATAYSGNVDFLDETVGFPVNFSLTEVTVAGAPYPRGAVWADPDVAHLQARMRQVHGGGATVSKVVKAGVQRIKRQLSTAAVAAIIGAALKEAASQVAGRLAGSQTADPQAWTAPRPSTTANIDLWDLHRSVLFSIVVPTYNISRQLLEECITSVQMQTYPHWELCICDDASTNPETLAYLKDLRGSDPRIKIRFLEKNRGISGATNAAIEMASGDYVLFLDNDDTIAQCALSQYAAAIRVNPSIDCLYCDEDKISANGTYVDHYFKPDWSPEHLESVMYMLHFLGVRKSLLLQLGASRAEYTGAQDYDLALRLSRHGAVIHHVPAVLYHWRMIEGSASAAVEAKPKALINAQRALEDYAAAKYGEDAFVTPGLIQGYFRLQRGRLFSPPVTLVITTNNTVKDVSGRRTLNLVTNFVKSIIDKTRYSNYRINVVSNGHIDDDLREILKSRGEKEHVYVYNEPFNFATKANFAINTAETEYVVLLNDDMEIISPDWLDALMDHIRNDEIGAVGARLLYPDNRIQHVGMVIGVNETSAHMYHSHDSETSGYNGYAKITRNYSAVTGACMATKKSLYNRVGGFDERYATDYNDTDYCLRVREAGYRIVYTPFAELYHFESQTAVRTQQNPEERTLFINRWRHVIDRDPYYNPNQARDRIDFCHDPRFWPARR